MTDVRLCVSEVLGRLCPRSRRGEVQIQPVDVVSTFKFSSRAVHVKIAAVAAERASINNVAGVYNRDEQWSLTELCVIVRGTCCFQSCKLLRCGRVTRAKEWYDASK